MLENPRPFTGVAVFANRPGSRHARGRVSVTAGLALRELCAVRPDAAAKAGACAADIGEKRAMSGINLYYLGLKRPMPLQPEKERFFRVTLFVAQYPRRSEAPGNQ